MNTKRLQRAKVRLEHDLRRVEHKLAMQDPAYRAMYEKFGDPVTVGQTLARVIIGQRKQKKASHETQTPQ